MRAWLNSLPTAVLIRYARIMGYPFVGRQLPQRSAVINFLWQMSMSGTSPLTIAQMQAMLYRASAKVPEVFVMEGAVK